MGKCIFKCIHIHSIRCINASYYNFYCDNFHGQKQILSRLHDKNTSKSQISAPYPMQLFPVIEIHF